MKHLPESLIPYSSPMYRNTSCRPDQESTLRRKLSLRGTVLRALGVGFMGLAWLAHWLSFSDPTVPFIPVLFVTVGVLVFVSGLALHR
jgi:hypothetical protein